MKITVLQSVNKRYYKLYKFHVTLKDLSISYFQFKYFRSFPEKRKSLSSHKSDPLPPLRVPGGRNRVHQDANVLPDIPRQPPVELHNAFSSNNEEQNNASHNSGPDASNPTYKREGSMLGSLIESRTGQDSVVNNQRLLLNVRNPLHVIDGTTHRYYLGIIDFFTKYECKQRMARVLKTVKLCTLDHSTVPPDKYAERFLRFISDRTIGFSKSKSDLWQ